MGFGLRSSMAVAFSIAVCQVCICCLLFIYISVAQLVASMSFVVIGGVVEAVGSNLASGKLFTASIGSVD